MIKKPNRLRALSKKLIGIMSATTTEYLQSSSSTTPLWSRVAGTRLFTFGISSQAKASGTSMGLISQGNLLIFRMVVSLQVVTQRLTSYKSSISIKGSWLSASIGQIILTYLHMFMLQAIQNMTSELLELDLLEPTPLWDFTKISRKTDNTNCCQNWRM